MITFKRPKVLDLYKEDFVSDDVWNVICEILELDGEETDSIEVQTTGATI